MKKKSVLFILLIVSLLTGCGFHLRQPADLPPALLEMVLMPNATYTPLQRELTQQLNLAGGVVVDESKNAAILTVLGEDYSETTLSIGIDGQAREKRLLYSLSYQLADAQGNMLIPPSIIKMDHVVKYDPNFVIAKSYEQQKMIQGMRSDAVSQLLNRLSRLRI